MLVSLKIDVDATATLSHMESQTEEAGRAASDPAGVRKRLSWVQLSDGRLRQITNEQGKTVANEQREQAEQILQDAVSMQQIRIQRAL